MRLEIITIASIAKGINKGRLTGNFSLFAVAKLNMLMHYLPYTKDDTKSFLILQDRINKMLNRNFDLCNIREASCTPGTKYVNTETTIKNPYGPVAPVVVEPTPEPANLPADISDYSMTVEDNTTTVLTAAMFLSVYSDPENDSLDAIKVDKVHSTNSGIFYFNGAPIYVGLVITREQLEAGLLTHVGIDTDTVLSDSFDFSARDEVNGTWVN